MAVIDINVGRNFIDVFPEPTASYNGASKYVGAALGFTSSYTVPCSSYDDSIRTIYLSSSDLPGVLAYRPGVDYPFFTHFVSGSGVYIVDALSAFQIVVE